MSIPAPRGLRLKLALALLLVVAGTLAIVYLILVPSLEAELVDARLDQLEQDAPLAVRGFANQAATPQEYAEAASSVFNARVVVYSVLERQRPARLFIFGDSRTTSSLDVERDRIALLTAETGRLQRGTVERDGRRFAEVAIPVSGSSTVILLSDSVEDALSTLHLVEDRLVLAGLIGLLVAGLVGSALASMHARRIRRLERVAERIAAGRFDEPVVDGGRDELGELAAAFERMRVRLQKLDRARSEFIANASHELRTPLFSLGGFLELLEDDAPDERTRAEFLGTMREQVDRLTKLATDLLDLSRLDAGQMSVAHEPVDLGAVARVVVEEFAARAERRGHPIEVVIEGSPIARGDELRAVQVARALLDNAITHTPEGTPVTVRARSDREHAYLEVEDAGRGVSAEHAPHVFDRFYRAEGGLASGSGLGLAIARELAEMMGGTVVLDSTPGKTVVRAILGAAPTSVAAEEQAGGVFT